MSFGTPLIVGGTLARPTVTTDPTNVAVGAAAVVATGATGGLAGVVAALIAGGMAAFGSAAANGPGDEPNRCAAILAEIEADAGTESRSTTTPRQSKKEFR